jgi:Fic family protein
MARNEESSREGPLYRMFLDSGYHFYTSNLQEVTEVISSSPSMPSRLQKALGLFKRHKRLTAADYQELTALGTTQAVADLKKLERGGSIKRQGGGRSTIYLWVGL